MKTEIIRRGLATVFASFLALSTACATGGRSAADDIRIIDKPIPFPQERIDLTRAYIKQHYGLDVQNIEIVPRIIVLHWTAGSTLQGDYNTFVPTTIESSRSIRNASELNVGIKFLVDRDGTIYRLMPETWMARHVIGLNYNSIGVENVGGSRAAPGLTDQQMQANIRLVRYLAKKYPTIRYLIGHHEYRQMEHNPLWLERDTTYRTGKNDPGEKFMAGVRAGVRDLNLEKPHE